MSVKLKTVIGHEKERWGLHALFDGVLRCSSYAINSFRARLSAK